jgi:hypothetical protein
MTHSKDTLTDGDDTRQQGVQVCRAPCSVHMTKEMKKKYHCAVGTAGHHCPRDAARRSTTRRIRPRRRPIGVEGEGGCMPRPTSSAVDVVIRRRCRCPPSQSAVDVAVHRRSPPSTSPPRRRSAPSPSAVLRATVSGLEAMEEVEPTLPRRIPRLW